MHYSLKPFTKRSKGFTIVELIAVVGVIAILAGIVIIGYGAWNRSISDTAVKTELDAVKTAMSDYRTFNNGYGTSIPSTYNKSNHANVEYLSGDDKGYCVRATSVRDSSIIWYMKVTGTESQLTTSACTYGTWKDIAGSNDATCGITMTEKIYCWGSGSMYSPQELGMGTIPSGATITNITAGSGHYCVIADGWIYCWGNNANGRLGDNTTTTRATPITVQRGAIPTGVTIVDVAAGGNHTCAIASNNRTYCWGYGANGQLGRNSTSVAYTPVATTQGAIPAGVTLKDVSAGGSNTCGVGTDNLAYCWGTGTDGALGNGSTTQNNQAVAVSQGAMPSGVTISSLSVGANHSCVIASNNLAYCWGAGFNGRLGNGGTSSSTTPVAVQLGSVTPTNLNAGGTFSCVVSNGASYCWGNNTSGQFGSGFTPSTSSTPIATQNGDKPASAKFVTVRTANEHACGITTGNDAYCWGLGESGQVGDGTGATSYLPRKLPAL